MVELVLHHHIVLAEQGLQQPQIGEVARTKQQGARIAKPVSKFFFEQRMFAMVSADQVGSRAADALPCRRFLQCRRDIQRLCEPQIVVAAEVQQLTPTDDHPRAMRRLHDPKASGQVCSSALGSSHSRSLGDTRTAHLASRSGCMADLIDAGQIDMYVLRLGDMRHRSQAHRRA